MMGEASGTAFEREAVGRRLGVHGFHTLQLFDANTPEEQQTTASFSISCAERVAFAP
jgi:hypothetical protein